MNIHFHVPVAKLANFLLQLRGLAVCLAQAQFFVHLEVQLDKKLAVLLHGGQVVDGEAQALCGRANCFE